jgi:LAS superfamily LD-carboxypeptidase LdcB
MCDCMHYITLHAPLNQEFCPNQTPTLPAAACVACVVLLPCSILQAGASPTLPSPTLAPALLDAARALLGLAHSCIARSQTLSSLNPAVEPQLQQLAAAAAAGPLAAAQQQLSAVGSDLLSPAGVQWGLGGEAQQRGLGLRAALAAAAALDALQQAAAVEGLAAVVVLRLAEVRSVWIASMF